MEYAIIKTGGKQYRVSVGDMVDVEKLAVEPGSEIELSDVVAVSKDGKVSLGQPVVEGAKVIAQVHEHNKDKKIRVFKYKRKTRYRKTTGHRQSHTRLQVVEIQNGGTA
ncbi:MAG: 50S ribosomal protein L21 [SAR202 cluster bacterium]|nr:50S ribosomal protein L21 [SAR202 cluster bacterium]